MWKIRTYFVLSVAAFGILYFYATIYVLILMPFLFLKMRKTVRFIMHFWARTVFPLIGKKLHIEGAGNIKTDKTYILVANHSSLFDIIAIMSFYPGISWFGHERLTRIPLFRNVLELTDYVPLKKTSFKNTKEMVNQLIDKSRGHTIAIFPEGTRTLNGKINDFYRGFVILLRSAEIDVLPVTLNGFYCFKPKNRFYIDFSSKLYAIIHESIPREELISRNDSEIIDIVRNKIESSLLYQH